MNTAGIGLFTTSDGTLNKVTPVSAIKEVETPFVVDMTVEKEKLNSVEDGIFFVIIYAGYYFGWSSYARVMIEFRADVELKDNIIVAMPKIIGEGHYICNVHVKYEWKPPRCASFKVFRHIHEECPKNTGAVLNSVNNDAELGTNGGTTNLVNNKATSSGSSFMNIDNSSTRTSIIDKIRKFKELFTSGKATLVDEAGNPLKKVEFLDDYDSEDEVASVDNDMARSMAS
ncbi:hypothetical protein Tco_1141021 [Tanacetum coccineum]